MALSIVTRILPEPLLLRLLPRALRWDPSSIDVAVADRADVALFIGPANSAGQGYQWARAVRERLPGATATSMMTIPREATTAAFPVDMAVPLSATLLSRRWQRQQRGSLLEGFSHILVESARPPYGDDLAGALTDWKERNIRAAFLWHGSDIRLPSAHAEVETDSPFGRSGDYPVERTAILERNAQAHLQLIERFDLPVFVSTPGLLDVSRSRWLPVVVDVERWAVASEPLTADVPIVVYAPSNAALKGDAGIDQRLREIEKQGLIRYQRVEDVPSDEMPALYRNADIVLDQFRLGDYGVAACEAMAAGRLVIGHVSDTVRERVRVRTGRALPVLESRFADIDTTILAVLADRDAARDMARHGPEFVSQVHDGTLSVDALGDFLGVRSNTSQGR